MSDSRTHTEQPPGSEAGVSPGGVARERAAEQRAQRLVSGFVTGLGIDPFAPFSGLDKHPGLVQIRGTQAMGRTLRRVMLRRAGVGTARALSRRERIPAATRPAFLEAFDAAVALHAARLSNEARRWRQARQRVPALDGLERHAARCVDQHMGAHPAAWECDEHRVGTVAHDALRAKRASFEAALMRSYGIPERADDFELQRRLLRTRLRLHATEHARRRLRAAATRRYAAAQAERRAEGLAILFDP